MIPKGDIVAGTEDTENTSDLVTLLVFGISIFSAVRIRGGSSHAGG